MLNLGAGSATAAPNGKVVINVDHVRHERGDDQPFVVADALRLPFRRHSFAGAVLKDIIEHVDDPIGVLLETGRVAPCIVVTTPRAIPRAVWNDPTHIRGFTRRALIEALTRAGFHVTSGPNRIGAVPMAGRLRLENYLEVVLRIPGFGHRFGTNWIVRAAR
ncbi:MAG TPA: methyltransferase domain-containing protein [Acidimicrobiales bacterium]